MADLTVYVNPYIVCLVGGVSCLGSFCILCSHRGGSFVNFKMEKKESGLLINLGNLNKVFFFPLDLSGLKSITWNGKQYFLTLANLWVNLVNADLP